MGDIAPGRTFSGLSSPAGQGEKIYPLAETTRYELPYGAAGAGCANPAGLAAAALAAEPGSYRHG
jgi:hypothetical protein